MENKLFKEKYPKLYDENARRYRLAPVYDGADCGSVYSEWIRSKEELEKLSKIISSEGFIASYCLDEHEKEQIKILKRKSKLK